MVLTPNDTPYTSRAFYITLGSWIEDTWKIRYGPRPGASLRATVSSCGRELEQRACGLFQLYPCEIMCQAPPC